MPARPLDQATLRKALRLLKEHGGNVSRAAAAANISRPTFQHQVREAQRLCVDQKPEFEVSALPAELPSAEELLARRKKDFLRKETAAKARRLIPIKVNVDGPIGVAHFGDPHVDDDGTDLALLQQHVECVKRTPALFAGNVGDATNNWIGRLARLYGEQGTSAAEGWVLTEWLIASLPWLWILGGNHDVWSGAGDPIKWLSAQAGVLYEWHGARIELQFPNGRTIRVNARHDFTGHSQWNTAHGPAKAIQMGWRDHILTCGHKHTSGYQVLKDPATGLVSHAIRVGSYKTLDRYALEKGLPDQTVFVCPVTIIRPEFADDDPRLVTTLFDPQDGAEILTWLRKKDGHGPTKSAKA